MDRRGPRTGTGPRNPGRPRVTGVAALRVRGEAHRVMQPGPAPPGRGPRGLGHQGPLGGRGDVRDDLQGQGHETTFAQIVAHELDLSPDDVEVVHGDTDRTPFGLGTYGSRSTPVSGAAAVVVARKVRERARVVAAAMLEAAPEDLEWAAGRWQVRGDPEQGRTLPEIAMAAHSSLELPDGVEGHLDAETVYNPPNLTYPLRRVHLRGGRGPGHRRGGAAPVHRGGRLRGPDQPDDRGGSGARRPGRRGRHGADAGHQL